MLSEKDLIKGCQNCKIKAQEELYNRYSRKMYGICYHYTNSVDDAKDLLHEGFIKIFDKIRQYKGEGSFEGWMRRIMVNVTIDFIKKKKSRPDFIQDLLLEDSGEELSGNENWGQETEDDLDYTQDEILSVINKLPDELRLIFNMFCLEQYSHKEISELLSMKEDTCRSKLRRARTFLRKYLKELKGDRIKQN